VINLKKIIKFCSLMLLTSCLIATSTISAFASTGSSQAQPNIDKSSTKIVTTQGFIQYSYENAPAQVKSNYEADCKAVNKIPSKSDVMLVPSNNVDTNSVNVNTITAVPIVYYTISYTSSTGIINISGSDGSKYSANVNTSYVGYNNTTRGSSVYCAQIILDILGYGLSVDGLFGPATHSAVESFQISNKLSVDSTIGPNTWRMMLTRANLL
jgi:peptidoglycan hydrolase-like protein with peptidoglycan-binding domain